MMPHLVLKKELYPHLDKMINVQEIRSVKQTLGKTKLKKLGKRVEKAPEKVKSSSKNV